MKSFILISILFLSLTANAEWIISQIVDSKGKVLKVESIRPTSIQILEDEKIKRMTPEYIAEEIGFREPRFYQEVIVSDHRLKELNLDKSFQLRRTTPVWAGAEVRSIVNQGPSSNRIDLTIVGDGYTEEEKDKFFDDVERMVSDMFQGQTFASYLPLFNIHAVFVPSKESGISDVVQKNTALGLYRSPKGSKRAIMPGKTFDIDRAIDLAPDTDYPLLIANDDYYGGLGGKYAISTRSVESGTVVLRHELGHNFGEVGEEYDGGQVYRGANHSATSNVHWKKWIKNGNLEVYDSQFLSGNYLWSNLKDGSFKANFNFPSDQYLFDIDISSVGWATPNDVEVVLNGTAKDLDGVWTKDRSFFKFAAAETLSKGSHSVEIREKIKDGDNVIAFANIYAHPANINKGVHHIGAYNTFYGPGRPAGYRPTYDSCLMRDMRTADFCAVDKENMWRKFFGTVKLIDRFDVRADKVEVQTPALDYLKLSLYKFENQIWVLKSENEGAGSLLLAGKGEYKIEASFLHPELVNGNGGVTQTVTFKL